MEIGFSVAWSNYVSEAISLIDSEREKMLGSQATVVFCVVEEILG